MEKKRLIKGIGVVLLGSIISFTCLGTYALSSRQMTTDELAGKKYFEGSARFQNGGPSCISCHSVKNEQVAKGGLLAKDLTDVYSRMGEGISAWLSAPSFPPMAASYQNHPLSENERTKLTAFLKYTDDVKVTQKHVDSGSLMMLFAGLGGLAGILILISLIWFKQKRKMVKQEIFDRQSKAWDAKH